LQGAEGSAEFALGADVGAFHESIGLAGVPVPEVHGEAGKAQVLLELPKLGLDLAGVPVGEGERAAQDDDEQRSARELGSPVCFKMSDCGWHFDFQSASRECGNERRRALK
jgi:hypothetical protein